MDNYFLSNTYYANSLDPYVPELWAQESIAILEENMVVGMLTHRDFSPMVAAYGDTVNTRKPAEFSAKRKSVNDNVTVQDASATNIAVPLDQLVHTSFLIRDGEESKGFKNLVVEYLRPAMIAQARFVDQVLLGQYVHFRANSAGKLQGLTSSTAKGDILDMRKVMNENKAWETGRNIIWTPNSETEVLKLDLFVSADKIGDDGTAMREASLGRKLQFNHWMSQNMTSATGAVDGAADAVGAVNNAAGYAKGTVTFTVDGFTAAVPNNSWITVAGDDTPLRVVSTVGGATPTSITVESPGLRHAVVDDAVVSAYGGPLVNNASGYAAGYDSTIVYDDDTNAPQVGQGVTFHTDPTSEVYTIIQVDTTNKTILLDRPLAAAISDDQQINLMPPGDYNFAFHRNAMTLVIRPLAAPQSGTGALSSVINHNGYSMRAVITYDGNKQGHLVTLDMLMGVKVLDTDLGGVIYG